MKSNKTTITGILIILGAVIDAAVAYLTGHPVGVMSVITGIGSGVGFLFAGDHSAFAKAVNGLFAQLNSKEKQIGN